jgi:hypothetical protein
VILIRDSGNENCRAGILAGAWSSNPHVRYVRYGFAPGQIMEHSLRGADGQVWGVMALA